jgi:hypothetical protein
MVNLRPPRMRRNVRYGQATRALAAGATIATGTGAYADQIRFENPAGIGHFNWMSSIPEIGLSLDVARNSNNQTGIESTPSSFQQFNVPTATPILGAVPNNGQVEWDSGTYFLQPLAANAVIPSGAGWNRTAYAYYTGYGYAMPAGVPAYLGVRFNLGQGNQYGWIGVIREGHGLDAFAWGYETQPGVPIPAGAIPEPGSLAMLALGATALLARRRNG